MAQPTIISAQSKGYAVVSDSGTSRTYEDIVIPAEANTVIMFVVLDTAEASRTWDTLTYGNAAAIKTFQVSVSSQRARVTEAAIFDVSAAGAMTADLVATISGGSTTVDSRCGVVCSTGFVESFFTSNDGSSIEGESIAFSPNYENNLFVLCTGASDHDGGFSYTTGTEIFVDSAGGANVVGVSAGSQATNASDGSKTIAYTAPTVKNADFGVLLSSQKNPFATNFGPVIRPIISHDVIS